jgi:hypothetical protein
MKTPFLQLNLSSVEHVWVEYHIAESFSYILYCILIESHNKHAVSADKFEQKLYKYR